MKKTGYSHQDGTITPTTENINAQINYEYKARFVPVEVLDEARADFPSSFGKPDFESSPNDIEEWFLKWFGGAEK